MCCSGNVVNTVHGMPKLVSRLPRLASSPFVSGRTLTAAPGTAQCTAPLQNQAVSISCNGLVQKAVLGMSPLIPKLLRADTSVSLSELTLTGVPGITQHAARLLVQAVSISCIGHVHKAVLGIPTLVPELRWVGKFTFFSGCGKVAEIGMIRRARRLPPEGTLR